MMYLYAITSVILVSLISLVGISFLYFNDARLRRLNFLLVSLAVGSMFGDSFFHLLPEVLEESDLSASIAVLCGIIIFFILEKILRWRHEHGTDHKHPVGTINLVADGMHNLIDGLLIGGSYMVSPTIGVATTIAVILHEIPQEIGDFGILIHAGYSRSRALLFNLLSGLMAIAGTLLAFGLGRTINDFSHLILAFTAGSFIYIAGSDLIPELHENPRTKTAFLELFMIILGMAVMFGLTFLE